MEGINLFGIGGVAFIVVMCLLVGMAAKNLPVNNKWIPVICGTFGGALAALAMASGVDIHATNYFDAVAIGIVSGLGSVGCHQLVKQLTNGAAPDANVDYKAGYFNILDEYKRFRDTYEKQINAEDDRNEGDAETQRAVAEIVEEVKAVQAEEYEREQEE